MVSERAGSRHRRRIGGGRSDPPCCCRRVVAPTGSTNLDRARIGLDERGRAGRRRPLLSVSMASPGGRGSVHIAGDNAALLLTIARERRGGGRRAHRGERRRRRSDRLPGRRWLGEVARAGACALGRRRGPPGGVRTAPGADRAAGDPAQRFRGSGHLSTLPRRRMGDPPGADPYLRDVPGPTSTPSTRPVVRCGPAP